MTEVVCGARKVRVPKPKPNKRPSVVGPPVPDIRKAIDLAGKTPATVASEMGVAVEELEVRDCLVHALCCFCITVYLSHC